MIERLDAAFRAIDGRNAQDPRRETFDGQDKPLEIAHAERMTRWVERLAPAASEALRIAARGQHIARWTVPREKYPEGRAGYLRWREELKTFHAVAVAEILKNVGYEADFVERVRALILKKNIKTDPEAQTLEDALCLVFLETQLAALKAKTPDDKMADIVKKTWAKMSPAGHAAALSLPLPEDQKNFLQSVLKA